MQFKLDVKDKKILDELEYNARQPDSKIAKKIMLKREVVGYRIKRMMNSGIIKKFLTLVDTARLGYTTFRVYIRLNNFTVKQEEEIIEKIKKNNYVKWICSLSGQYDLLVVMIARSRLDFDRRLDAMFEEFDQHVSKSLTLSTIKVFKDAKYLFYKNQETDERLIEKVETRPEVDVVKIDKTDMEILQILAADARMNVVDISRKLKVKKIVLTPEAVSYRLKKMHKDHLIRGYKAAIDFENLGYLWYVLLFNLKRIPPDLEQKLRYFFFQNKKILYADKTLGEWNLRVELLVHNNDEFHNELIKLRKLLHNYLNKYELMIIFKDHSVVSFTKGIYLDSKKSL